MLPDALPRAAITQVPPIVSSLGAGLELYGFHIFRIMARALRIEFSTAIYHVTASGDARLPIFEDYQDRVRFLAIHKEAVKRFNWLCHA
jgi:hypothetical protein